MKSIVTLLLSLNAVAFGQGEAPVQVLGTAPAAAGSTGGVPSGRYLPRIAAIVVRCSGL